MNATILAARTATAIADIEAQVQRLGGEFTFPAPRGDAAVQRLQTLEGIAAALAGIADKSAKVDAPVEADKSAKVDAPVEADKSAKVDAPVEAGKATKEKARK